MTRPAYLIHLPDRCTRALMLHMAVGELDVEYPYMDSSSFALGLGRVRTHL